MKRAWHLPVCIIMEQEVATSVEVPTYARCDAWFRLVKLWISGTCGLSEGSMEMHTYGWTAVLTRLGPRRQGRVRGSYI